MKSNDSSDSDVFFCRITKDGKVFIAWHGKQAKVLQGKEAKKFINRIQCSGVKESQMIMAKATGNFKRGNERRNRNDE